MTRRISARAAGFALFLCGGIASLAGSASCQTAREIAGTYTLVSFTNQQGDKTTDQSVWIAQGETDFSVNYAPVHIASTAAGVPIKILGGLHSGSLELIANDSVQASPASRAGAWACTTPARRRTCWSR